MFKWCGSRVLAIVLIAVLGACSGGGGGDSSSGGGSSSTLPSNFLLGAHYYVWFPGNLRQGYLRGKLRPEQEFLVGDNDSNDPSVAEAHINWASQSGIDFFTLDWWPRRDNLKENIDRGFMRASNIGSIKFCMFYESGDIGYDPETGTIPIVGQNKEDYIDGLVEIAEKYFSHPSYLKINGRPVIVLYITRTFTGDVSGMVTEARRRIKERGYDVFLIADEIFWTATPDQNAKTVFGPPRVERIKLFDAITAYNFYEGSFQEQKGYGVDSTFISDVRTLLDNYSNAGTGVPVLPSIIPGYNDRGVRPEVDHYAIPRQWTPTSGEGSFFSEMFDRVLVPYLDPALPIGFITSWNEWNEDTAIEPLTVTEPTAADNDDGNVTQGYKYSGFGFTYLDVIKQKRQNLQ